ncbi:hypothetical protein F4778DRAFT_759098 [Xylariomycetidae sp. FL2044]|nr:hypothetical protein F4778DRAFT_759098 [Xylariomycetidae sp. FL2044]
MITFAGLLRLAAVFLCSVPRGFAQDDATKYLMVFGDSYSTTGSWIGGDKPSSSNPIGNPSLPGTTTSGGLNWVGQVTTQLNSSLILTYDFAVTGATTDNDIVDTYAQYNFDDQVEDLFTSYLATPPDYAPWTAENALVAVWVGINDVGEPFWDRISAPVDELMERYFGLLQTLYDAGLRKFVLLTVPPFDRAPAIINEDADSVQSLQSDISTYNAALADRLDAFQAANGGVTGQIFDTTASFETALNDPAAYGARDATCVSTDGSCLWADTYHPSLPIHELVAKALVGEVDFF